MQQHPSIENVAQVLYEQATDPQFSSMFPADCTSQEQRANWCLREFHADMAAEAPWFTTKVMECVREKFKLKSSPEGESFSPTPRTGQ